MNKILPNKFGLSLGIAGAIFYVGCAVLMRIVSEETFVFLANNLCHGMDMTTIVRMDISLSESVLGIIEIFVLCWLFGVIAATSYNRMLKFQKY